MTAPATTAGRDRYLDLLRALALVRVVAYHTVGGAVFSLAFPSMGVMFALAGALMARSLRRPAAQVLRSRTRRLLLPLWVYSATVLALLLAAGWRPGVQEPGSWWQVLLWFLPISNAVFPETVGTGAMVDPGWAVQAGEILWYLRAYFWFMVLSPVLLAAFRARPWPVLLAPLALGVPLALELVALPEWAGPAVVDFATYGSCWVLGFAHATGRLRRVPLQAVLAAGLTVMALGLWWAAGHQEGGWDLNEIPLAQALWSLGFCAVLLRISPVWQQLPRPLRFLERGVSLLNNRAMTVYLWHNLLLVATVVVIDVLWNSETLADAVPALLNSSWTQFALVWPMLAVVFLAVGWVEDVSAGRRARLWPSRTPPPRPLSQGTVPQDTLPQSTVPGRSWLYPRQMREDAASSVLHRQP